MTILHEGYKRGTVGVGNVLTANMITYSFTLVLEFAAVRLTCRSPPSPVLQSQHLVAWCANQASRCV